MDWAGWRVFQPDGNGDAGRGNIPGPRAVVDSGEKEEMKEHKTNRDPFTIARQGSRPKWLRPGGGFWSNTILDEAEAAGYCTVLGNVFSWDVVAPTSHNVWFTRERARPGCIIILHDRPQLLEILRNLLPSLSSEFKIVTLTELFQEVAAVTAPGS